MTQFVKYSILWCTFVKNVQIDVIIADLDGGSIVVPDGVSIPMLPHTLNTMVKSQLAMVLHPELSSADFAFPPLALKPSVQFQVDKEVRAIFLRLFALLFQGYRSCLVIIRIHPKTVIKLHKVKLLCHSVMDLERTLR